MMRGSCTALVVTLGSGALPFAAQASAQSLVEWPVSANGNGHWYEIVPLGGPSGLATADYLAGMRRGSVAELETAGEHEFVVSALGGTSTSGPAFIGLERRPLREPNMLDATHDAFAWLRDAASERMVDVVLVGDSNVCFSGWGWDHGLQFAFDAAGWPCAAVGPTPFNDDGGTTGWQLVKTIGPLQHWPSSLGNYDSSTSNAPPLLAARMNFPNGYPSTGTGYAWLSGGTANIGGGMWLLPDHPFIKENAAFEMRIEHGKLPKGGRFTPSAWAQDGTAVHSSAPVQCAAKTFSMGEALLQIPSSFHGGQALRLTIDGGEGVQAPLFLGWTTLERAGLSSGWCVSVLDWHGGATTQRLAEDIESFRGETADRWVAAIRSRQMRHGTGVRAVFVISSGMNDYGLTVDQHEDGLRRMISHLTSRWVAGGGNAGEVRFILMTSHDPWMNDPTEHMVALRQRSRQIAADLHEVTAVDLGAIPMSTAFYDGGGAGSPHLSRLGYEALAGHIVSALDGSQGERCGWRWRSGSDAEAPVDDSGLSPCTRARGAFDPSADLLRGITESTQLSYAVVEYSADCDGDGIIDRGAVALGLVPDVNGNAIPDGCECLGDIDQSGAVDSLDLAGMLDRWGAGAGVADLNHSGFVDAADLVMLLSRWGPCGGG